MLKRMILMFLVVTAFVTAIGFIKYRQVQAAIAQGSSYQPPPEAVTTVVAGQESWAETLDTIGSVTAVNDVTVSADLPGVVESIAFESGKSVRAGDLLVQLDTRQEKAQLRSAEAAESLARLNLDRAKGLRQEGVVSQADFDTASAAFDQAEAMVAEARATIGRKTIRAPFAGVLGIRKVNLGMYLNAGDPVVPLQSLDPIFVDFSVPQQEIARVRVGGSVNVTTDDMPDATFAGTVAALDSVVDAATRNIKVRTKLDNPGHHLRPGMFVRARVSLPETTSVIPLPASAIRYAPYGNSVFIVEQVKGPKGDEYLGVRQQVVTLGVARGDQVAVLSGIKPGEQVVTSGVFKLRNGAAVMVNNTVQPGNEAAPKPENS
jgi:membrane fusion protein, multidrug efflux system